MRSAPRRPDSLSQIPFVIVLDHAADAAVPFHDTPEERKEPYDVGPLVEAVIEVAESRKVAGSDKRIGTGTHAEKEIGEESG